MVFFAKVFISPRADVLDPQGDAVEHALHSLGYDEVRGVSLGRYLEVELDASDADAATARLSAMCETLLANTVVEDFRFELESRS
jgi:phosphoribosylformylglycinamidine synthase